MSAENPNRIVEGDRIRIAGAYHKGSGTVLDPQAPGWPEGWALVALDRYGNTVAPVNRLDRVDDAR